MNGYKLNEKHITYPYTVSHADLLKGGTLQFEMSVAPKMSVMQGHHYGKLDYSGMSIIPVPFFEST